MWGVPVRRVALLTGAGSVFTQQGLFFSGTAVVTFGGAYAVLAYVAQQAVQVYGWLAPGEMVRGLALAETTPGPLIMVVQFVAFLGAYRDPGDLDPWVAAVLASLLVTWVTFVPSFLFVLLGAPYMERLRGNRSLSAALTGITAAVVGVIANLGLYFAVHTLFAETQHVGRPGCSRSSSPTSGRCGPSRWPSPWWPPCCSSAALVGAAHAGRLRRPRPRGRPRWACLSPDPPGRPGRAVGCAMDAPPVRPDRRGVAARSLLGVVALAVAAVLAGPARSVSGQPCGGPVRVGAGARRARGRRPAARDGAGRRAFALVALRFGLSWELPRFSFLAAAGVLLTVIDLQHRLLPNRVLCPSFGRRAVLLTVAARRDAGLAGVSPGRARRRRPVRRLPRPGADLPEQAGMGDVKLAACSGSTSGWLGWAAVLLGAAAGFVVQALSPSSCWPVA